LLADPQAEIEISIAAPKPKQPAMEPLAAARAMAEAYSSKSIPATEYFAQQKQMAAAEADKP
jgi:hypothetical protein